MALVSWIIPGGYGVLVVPSVQIPHLTKGLEWPFLSQKGQGRDLTIPAYDFNTSHNKIAGDVYSSTAGVCLTCLTEPIDGSFNP